MNFRPKNTDFIDIHSHNKEPEEGVFRIHNEFTSDFPQITASKPISIGLHPWQLSEKSVLEMPVVLKKTVSNNNVLAIGECGLDSHIQTPLEEQLPAFRTQAEISVEYKKPLIIHCVKAFPELLNLRKEFKNATPWIIHGFNANQTIAAECVKMGIYISLSERLFKNTEKAEKITKAIPLSMVFAETDEDSLPIQEIYQTISGLYEMSLPELKSIIFENFCRVFSNGF